MNNNIRIGLLAVSATAMLSLAACKTTDDGMSQDTTAPPAEQAAPAATSMPPADSTMPPADTSTPPADDSTTPPPPTP
jgi:hypothetical protein